MVATTTYAVEAVPARVGYDLKVQGVGKTTCAHLGEIEQAARDLIVFRTGMPTERIELKVRRV